MAKSPLAFAGRLLFALLFLTSGLQKLVTYDHANKGGDIAKFVGTKVDSLNVHVKELTGNKIPIGKVGLMSGSSRLSKPLQRAGLPAMDCMHDVAIRMTCHWRRNMLTPASCTFLLFWKALGSQA